MIESGPWVTDLDARSPFDHIPLALLDEDRAEVEGVRVAYGIRILWDDQVLWHSERVVGIERVDRVAP